MVILTIPDRPLKLFGNMTTGGHKCYYSLLLATALYSAEIDVIWHTNRIEGMISEHRLSIFYGTLFNPKL